MKKSETETEKKMKKSETETETEKKIKKLDKRIAALEAVAVEAGKKANKAKKNAERAEADVVKLKRERPENRQIYTRYELVKDLGKIDSK